MTRLVNCVTKSCCAVLQMNMKKKNNSHLENKSYKKHTKCLEKSIQKNNIINITDNKKILPAHTICN